MPYMRKRGYKARKGGMRKGRKYVPKRARTLAGLAKKVAGLSRRVRKIPQAYHIGYALAGQAIERDYAALNLSNFTATQNIIGTVTGQVFNPGGTPLFGTQIEDLESNRLIDQSMSCQLKVECGAETSNITYTCYLVSLKDQMNQRNVFNPDTGELDLQSGTHYWVSPTASGAIGMVLLNPKCFNIKRKWKFTIGNNNQALSIASAVGGIQAQKTIYFKVPFRQTVTNIGGDVWGNMMTTRDPSKQYYLLMFNDDNTIDFQSQSFHFNAVRTVKVYE